MSMSNKVSPEKRSQLPGELSSAPENEVFGFRAESDDSSEDGGKYAFRRCGRKITRRLQKIDANNLTLNPVDPGNWDEWGVYYCSSRFGRHTRFNSNYFALISIILLGQSNFFHLIYLMEANGGVAFLLVLFMTYIFFGYPAYMMEMIMGQYTGRKPLRMIRLLFPMFSGLGIALYLRTLCRAIVVLGNFAICLYHCWDLLFCKGATSVLLKRIVTRERDYRKFKVFHGLEHPVFTRDPSDGDFDEIKWIMFICGLSVAVCFKQLKEFGAGMKVIVRLLLLFLAGYTVNGFLRIYPPVNQNYTIELRDDSIMFLPFKIAFKPNWIKLINGGVWVKATLFAMNSLELGTLIHPYLGSKMFFHYRCNRDGVYLILFSVTWNMIGVVGVLLWLGYVGINKNEIKAAFKEIDGHYGMFVVFIVKHIQAEMTQQIESDVLFFCTIFYFIVGTSALLACICYLYVLIDCALPESGHSMIKLGTGVWYVILFGVIFFPLALARLGKWSLYILFLQDGLRHLIFLGFYGANSWMGLFLIMCFSIAVSWSHGMARLLYDFYNVVHLKGYEVRTHYYPVPKIVVFLFTLVPLISLSRETIERDLPKEGPTDWSDPLTHIVGDFILFAPLIAIVFGAVHYWVKERRTNKTQPIFQPHRDFYKNKYHVSVCFKDYLFFDPRKIPVVHKKMG